MGNALRVIYSCFKPESPESVGVHGVSPSVTALAHDLLQFELTSQVPQGLSNHVVSARKTQAKWYAKILEAWKSAKPPPKTPGEASSLIILTLQDHQKPDVTGLLTFYGLPYYRLQALVEISTGVPSTVPQGVTFKLHTLPVDEKAVVDGDGMSVYVSTLDPRESSSVPRKVHVASVKRAKARAHRDYKLADALHKEIIGQNYRVIKVQDEDVLARKYRIRLRGIDAPENGQPYGQEAKEELAKLLRGKCLTILVYEEDQYGRNVGDVYCNGVFAQEVMLKKGLAWHYTAYDNRPEFANWQKQARAKRVGLWALPNPEKPWDWRRDRRDAKH